MQTAKGGQQNLFYTSGGSIRLSGLTRTLEHSENIMLNIDNVVLVSTINQLLTKNLFLYSICFLNADTVSARH
ncbi:hypothetical protein NVIRPANT_00925 [Pantoea sp. Nvir]|nr:hypothetical protein NVIRPANT_00925 [Pantoea sp. Nvir]